MRLAKDHRDGLSQAEWIVVAVVLLGALALFLPYLASQRVGSQRNLCEHRLTQLTQGVLFWSLVHNEFPSYAQQSVAFRNGAGERNAEAEVNWVVAVLPYVNREHDPDEWARRIPPDRERYGPHKRHADQWLAGRVNASEFIPALICPADPRARARNGPWLGYVANTGLPDAEEAEPADWPANGVLMHGRPRVGQPTPPSPEWVEEHDGAAFTLLLAENADAGRWFDRAEALVGFLWWPGEEQGVPSPAGKLLRINEERGRGDGSLRFARPAGFHPGGAMAAYCDGSTRFLSVKMQYLAFALAMSSDGADVRWPGSEAFIDPPYRVPPPPPVAEE